MRRWLRCALMMSLLAGPMPILAQGKQQGQQKTCLTNTATNNASTGGMAAGSASNQGMMNPQQIINQINRLEQLLLQLQSGQVTPPADSGITTAQAIQIVRQRITMLRNQLAQLRSSSATIATMSNNAMGRPQQGAGFGKRK